MSTMSAVEPMQPDTHAIGRTPRVRCHARRRNGEPCKAFAIHGSTVCRMHGGAAPQVRDKAKLRLASLIEPAITTLAREMATGDTSADRVRAANSILDRAGYGRISTIDIESARDILTDRIITVMENGK